MDKLNAKHLPFFIVTSDITKAIELFGNDSGINVLICDGTVIKTAARVNPTYFVMQLANIKGKYSYKKTDQVIEQINTVPVSRDYTRSNLLY